MSMLSATPPPIDTDLGEDMEEDQEEIDKFDKRRTGNKLTADRGPAEQTLIMQEIEYVLRSYNLTLTYRDKSLYYRDACVWVYNDRHSGGPSDRLYPNAPLVVTFNWVQQL
jgi:hypothetical protein